MTNDAGPASGDTTAATGPDSWPAIARGARLHFVSGKGGTGKTTVAAALAIALASGGKKVLLVECEGRQGLARLLDQPPLPPTDQLVVNAPNDGEVWALSIDIEYALLEYLDMFYNLGFASKAIRKVGAIDFVTTVAPGLRDVVITGKIKERVIAADKAGRQLYDYIVVDSPPTGRIGNFLDVTSAMSDLAKTGPIRNQSEGVVKLLHSDQTVIHLCTLLEAMPIQETAEAVDELVGKDLNIGAIFVNRERPDYLPAADLDEVAEGHIDSARVAAELAEAGLDAAGDDLDGLMTETVDYAVGVQAQQVAAAQLDDIDAAKIALPDVDDTIDLGALFTLARALEEAGV
ncbi:MAG: ArsA-related P-loop ATPase [Gordonia sp. (in: high G+C Gram-positive bacteria)]